MRIKCVASQLTDDQILALAHDVHQAFHVSPGKEYTVLGLDLSVRSVLQGTGVWVHLVTDYGNLAWAPLVLFEVLDARVSRYWMAHPSAHGLTLWPPALYQEFFHDDLSEGQPVVVAEFKRVVEELEAESQQRT